MPRTPALTFLLNSGLVCLILKHDYLKAILNLSLKSISDLPPSNSPQPNLLISQFSQELVSPLHKKLEVLSFHETHLIHLKILLVLPSQYV